MLEGTSWLVLKSIIRAESLDNTSLSITPTIGISPTDSTIVEN